MKKIKSQILHSRRQFIIHSLAGAAGALAFPTIVPSSVFGKDAPSNKIQVGQIGCGRIADTWDVPNIRKHDVARIVAVCDLDSKRLAVEKAKLEKFYTKGDQTVAVKTYGDYRELLRDGGVDAVAISTPDHWHAEPVVAAALAGKDIYVQKPLSMTLTEGRLVADIVREKKRVFQVGSQQRSDWPWPQFRKACELVRNGRIGTLQTIHIGLPTDPAGEDWPETPVPANLNYEMWLGSTPLAPYTENRVHPQKSVTERPGWLRIDSYCLGMITGWGAHHVDISHWGMGTELTGPIEAEGHAEFPKGGLWNVHGAYHVELKYANGVTSIIDNHFDNGIRFEGSKGWIFVSRGEGKATSSDPAITKGKPIAASDPAILDSEIGPDEIHLYKSADQHGDWLQSIQTRKPGATTPEIAHRSNSACIVAWIAMKLGRKLQWNPVKERFAKDDEADAMLSRPQRAPYGTEHLLKKA